MQLWICAIIHNQHQGKLLKQSLWNSEMLAKNTNLIGLEFAQYKTKDYNWIIIREDVLNKC